MSNKDPAAPSPPPPPSRELWGAEEKRSIKNEWRDWRSFGSNHLWHLNARGRQQLLPHKYPQIAGGQSHSLHLQTLQKERREYIYLLLFIEETRCRRFPPFRQRLTASEWFHQSQFGREELKAASGNETNGYGPTTAGGETWRQEWKRLLLNMRAAANEIDGDAQTCASHWAVTHCLTLQLNFFPFFFFSSFLAIREWC